nr:unnamed protein product [Spirometra erinaceieuropaei]
MTICLFLTQLLGIVGEELLKLAGNQALDSSEQQRRNLPALAERFEQLKSLASSLLRNLKFENRQKGSSVVSGTLSDIRGGLRLRLYTLLVKLQEYERALMGHCHIFTLTDDLIPQWRTLTPDSRRRSPPCLPKQSQCSVTTTRPLSCGSVRSLPVPPKPLPRGGATPPVLPPRVTPSRITSRATDEASTGSPRSEDLPVFSDTVDQFTELLLHLKTPIDAVDVNKAQVDDLLQQHEEARQTAYEEWHKLESRLSDALARPSLPSASLGGLKALQTEAKNRYMDWLHDWEQRRGFLVPRQRLLERIAELEHDLGECADRLDHIFGVACRSTAPSLTGQLSAESLPQASTAATATTTAPPWSSQLYLRQLEAISAEVFGMRQTVPAQQMFIDHMKEDSTAAYGVQASECMANVEEQWTLYQLKLQRLENALPTLRQGARLIAEAKAFTAALQSRLSASHRDPSQFTSLQNEANQLHEKIEQLLSSGQLLQQTNDPSVLPLDWLVSDLQATMAPLQEGSAEAEIIAANLCADEPDTGTLGSPAVVRAVLPAESSLPADRLSAEEDSGTSPVFSPGVFGAPDTIPGSPPSAPANHMKENRRPTFMNQLSNLTVSPGGSASLQCSFQGLGNRPRATWLFRPQGASPQFPGMALIDESTEAECNHSGARLWIPTVLYRHAGEYTATITNQETGESLSTSAVIQVIPEYKRGLADAYFEIEETPEVKKDQCVEFSMNFEGFERIPSRVMWLHDGRPIDSTKWAIAVSPRGTYARSNCLKKVDEGLYTCQVSEFEYGVHLESSAQLHVSCAPVDRAMVNHPAPKVNENTRATVAYEGSPLSLKCPLPASAFDNYDRTGSVQMQWFRDGVQLYDSGPRAPSYFIASNALFQDGNTVWRAGIAEGRVTLSTDRVRSVDAGCYSCRVFIGDDAYESSGIIDVSACPQFVEQLSRLKVFAGAAAVLTCRIQPWIIESASPTGQQQDGSMQITWYQYNTAITPEIQQKMGIEISQENGICTLRIGKVSRRFAGIYRCEARCPQCVCETSCQLLVEQPVAPIILEPVQYAVSRSDPNCIEMRVEYDALPKPEVDWMKDGLLLTPSSKIQISTGNDESTLRILEAKSDDRGKYEAVVRNVAGSARATINFDPSQAIQKSTLTGQERDPKSDAADCNSRPSSTSSSYQVTPRQRPNPAFLIRPQSVTANEGESVTFSCLIRPPATSGGRKIGRVIWRHRGQDLTSNTASTMDQRVQMKANDPVEGAFQLEISSLAQDDRGEYEVSAMDEDSREICNATFSLHVDGDKTENRYKIRLTSSAFFKSLPDMFQVSSGQQEKRSGAGEVIRGGRSLPLIPGDLGSRQDQNATLRTESQIDRDARKTDANASQFNKEYVTEDEPEQDQWCAAAPSLGPIPKSRSSLSLFDSNKSSPQKPAYHPRLPWVWCNADAGHRRAERVEEVCRYRSLPNLFDLSVTHESSIVVETFRLFRDDASVSCSSFSRLLMSSPSAQPSPIHRLTAGGQTHPNEADAASKGDFFIDGPSLPAAVAIASGGRLEVTCHVNGFPPPQVFWLKDGRQVRSGVDANDFQVKQDGIIHQLIIPEANKHHSGQWEVIGRNAAGLVLSSMTVTVDGRQKVIQSSQEDSPDRHFISITEPPPYGTSPPPPLANPRPGRLSLPSPAVHFEPLEVSLTPQKRTQIYLTHTVLGVPPQFTSLFHDQVCRAGSDVRFKCNIKGVPDPRVMWSFNGETLNNDRPERIQILRDATLCTLILKAVDRSFTGRYSVTAENATGVATCSALLYVEESIVEK